MTEFGYAGEILKVVLSYGNTIRLPTTDYVDKYIGGHGIAGRLHLDKRGLLR